MAEQMMQEAAGKAIPAGYQQTEVGVIPEDWVVISIQNSLTEKYILDQMDGNHGELYPKSHEFSSFGVPYIGATDFSNGYVDFKSCKFIPLERAKKFKKGIAKNGDVLFAHNATVGPVSLLNSDFDFVILSTTATYYRCDNDFLKNKYLAQYFCSDFFVSQYKAVMSQSTRNQVPILAQRKFLIVLPSKNEQTAIANVLSDSDALIDALEQLIAKKQAIKSATMQQLLTGRTRLPAFALRPNGTPKGYKPSELGDIPEDWEVCFLADIANLKNGYAFKSADYCSHGKYCIVTIACVQNGYMNISDSNKLNKLPFDIQSHQILTRGSLLISMTGNVGRVAKVECDDLLLNQRVGLVESKNIDRDFLFYLLRNPTFLSDMEEKAVGGAQGNIGKDDILSYSLIKPVCNKEQTAIATILSDMDNELQALTRKLEKARALKQGMMQQLLTGKIRLPLAAGA
ncbi:restriction endonuclease subunit S [Aeromonas jandaei]|uniref:restriction endonuclease subunit S n=1 Tax=Aeromonas jandaei TaxID=650 RepID=UPI0038D03B59